MWRSRVQLLHVEPESPQLAWVLLFPSFEVYPPRVLVDGGVDLAPAPLVDYAQFREVKRQLFVLAAY